MSFIRGSAPRSSEKRRKFNRSDEGGNKEVKYDNVWNSCVATRKKIKEMTGFMKQRKPKSSRSQNNQQINLQGIDRFVFDIHELVGKINEELGIESNEIKKLKTSHKDEIDGIRKDHYNEIRNCKQEQTASNNYIKELEQKYRTQEDALRQSQEEIKRIQQEHENEMKKYQQQQNARLQQTLHDKGKDGERLQLENQQIRQEYQALEQLAHNLNQQIQESNAEIHRLIKELKRKNGNMDQLLRQLNEVRESKESEKKQKDEALTRLQDIKRDSEKLQRENKQIIKEYQDLQQFANNVNRQFQDSIAEVHSVIAGDYSRSKTPVITDLSNPNRPLNIAEKFAKLYDNDWNDAMESLDSQGLEEKECIGILLHFFTDAYVECGKRVTELDSFIQHAVFLSAPDSQADESGDSGQELPAEITKPIKDLRKKLTDSNIEVLQKTLPQHLKEKRNLTEDQIKDCKDFIKDSIKYAWMMQIQDPPLYIEWEFPEETQIDTNILRSYTKAGEKVDYIVWPVLYLHKNGPVLNKGVVQPMFTFKQ